MDIKHQTFRQAYTQFENKKAIKYKREKELKLWENNEIGFSTYLTMVKQRKEKEKIFYQNNNFYEEYDEGILTFDEFVECSMNANLELMEHHQ